MNFLTDIVQAVRSAVTWWITIAPWERGVRVKWGKHDELLEPGIHLRIPIRDRMYRQSVRLRSTEILGQNLTTSDGHVVTIAFVVEWGIGNLLRVFRTIAHPERTLATRVKALLADYVAKHPLTEVGPLQISSEITAQVPVDEWGLADVHVRVTEFISAARTYRLLQGGHGYTELDHEVRWNDDVLTQVARTLK